MAPESAAEQLATALDRMRDSSLSETEHEVAVEEFVRANQHMLDKLGVERRPASKWGQVISALLVVAVVASMALNFAYSTTASSTADQANDTADKLARIQRASVIDSRENCERTNAARRASVKEKRQSAKSLKKQLAFWDAALDASKGQPPSPLTSVFLTFVSGLREELVTKEAGIKEAIESQAAVAIKPGSPIADCKLVSPLPGEKRQP
jgi:hypothetical protein